MKVFYKYRCKRDYFMEGEYDNPDFNKGNIYVFESTDQDNYILTLANTWPHYFDVDEDFLSYFELLTSWSK